MENAKLIQAMSQMMDNKLLPVHDKWGQIDDRIDKIDGRLDKIESSVESLDTRLGRVELTIGNDIQPDIRALAEGQTMLFEKLSGLEVNYNDLNEKVGLLLPATKRNALEINKLKPLK